MPRETLPTLHLATLERIAIRNALEQTNENRVRAARLLGIHVRTLHRKLREIEAEGMFAADSDATIERSLREPMLATA
jgi:DNA-binding NtrC family response regulator